MTHSPFPAPSDLPPQIHSAFTLPTTVLASPYLRGYTAGYDAGAEPPDLLQVMLTWPAELEPAELPDLGPAFEDGFRTGYREARLGRN